MLNLKHDGNQVRGPGLSHGVSDRASGSAVVAADEARGLCMATH